jgi:hypothetical protein
MNLQSRDEEIDGGCFKLHARQGEHSGVVVSGVETSHYVDGHVLRRGERARGGGGVRGQEVGNAVGNAVVRGWDLVDLAMPGRAHAVVLVEHGAPRLEI